MGKKKMFGKWMIVRIAHNVNALDDSKYTFKSGKLVNFMQI
jgi:hypothetical protein